MDGDFAIIEFPNPLLGSVIEFVNPIIGFLLLGWVRFCDYWVRGPHNWVALLGCGSPIIDLHYAIIIIGLVIGIGFLPLFLLCFFSIFYVDISVTRQKTPEEEPIQTISVDIYLLCLS